MMNNQSSIGNFSISVEALDTIEASKNEDKTVMKSLGITEQNKNMPDINIIVKIVNVLRRNDATYRVVLQKCHKNGRKWLKMTKNVI